MTKVYSFQSPTLQNIKRLSKRAETPNARPYDRSLDIIIHRLEVYEQRSAVLHNYYSGKQLLKQIDASGDEETVFTKLKSEIQRALKNLR